MVEVLTESFCLLWATTALVTCVVWEVVITIANAVFVVLESTLGYLFSAVALIVELLFAIPVVGRALQWIWNILFLAATLPFRAGEALLYFAGFRPQKKLRVCTIIGRDEAGALVASVPQVVALLNDAIMIFRKRLNIQILHSAAFQFSSGLTSSGPVADSTWIRLAGSPWSTPQLDTPCSSSTAGAFGEDLTWQGSVRQFKAITSCAFGAWRRVTGIGAPVTIYVIRSIGGGLFFGCALGPLTDYVTIAATFTPNPVDANFDDTADTVALAPGAAALSPPAASSPNNVLAHELGHICNLWHESDPLNLMFANASASDVLNDFQIAIVRESRHVSFL